MRRAIPVIVLALIVAACSNAEPDHSPENASEVTKALWEAARDGDLTTLANAIEQCADPFVEFEAVNGERYTAREIARARRLGELEGAKLVLADPLSLQLAEGALVKAENDWARACS